MRRGSIRRTAWLKKKGLIRLADAEESHEKEDPLASCLRGSIGIGKIAELTEAGDVQFPQRYWEPPLRA
jgi:hypothetical protein